MAQARYEAANEIELRKAMVLSRRLNSLLNRASILLLRPYIYHELPGWGLVYNMADYPVGVRWTEAGHRWTRGKFHGYEMLLDLSHWPDRIAFFLGRYYDLPTQLALKAILRAGDSFVDVGANKGMMSLLAARLVGPTGRVLAFEPNPAPRGALELAVKRNAIGHIAIHPIGLGDTESVLQLRVPKTNSGEGSFGFPAYDPADLETISCEVSRGDVILQASAPRAIKIDVEGYELYVLKGLETTLARAAPILVLEMISKHLENAGCNIEAVTSFLQSRGYRAYRLGLRSSGGRQVLSLTPEMPAGDVEGDYLWESASNPMPKALAALVSTDSGTRAVSRQARDRSARRVASTIDNSIGCFDH